jgi:predicted ArsR family transcriptional regulator
MPKRQRDGARLRILECNCPFPSAVRATREPCRLEAEFLAEIVGARPSRVEIARSEAERCCFEWDEVPGSADAQPPET